MPSIEVPIHEHIESLRSHLNSEGVEKPSLEVDRNTLRTGKLTRGRDFNFESSKLTAEIPRIVEQYKSEYGNNIHGLLDNIKNLRNELNTKNDEFKTQALNLIDRSRYFKNGKFFDKDYNDAVMLKAYTLSVNDTDYVEKNNKLHALHEVAENIIRMHDEKDINNGYIQVNSNGGRRSSLRHIRKTRKNRKTKHHKHTHRYRHTK